MAFLLDAEARGFYEEAIKFSVQMLGPFFELD